MSLKFIFGLALARFFRADHRLGHSFHIVQLGRVNAGRALLVGALVLAQIGELRNSKLWIILDVFVRLHNPSLLWWWLALLILHYVFASRFFQLGLILLLRIDDSFRALPPQNGALSYDFILNRSLVFLLSTYLWGKASCRILIPSILSSLEAGLDVAKWLLLFAIFGRLLETWLLGLVSNLRFL